MPSPRCLPATRWSALAEGRHDDALQLMRAAADAEEASNKHPVTPGNVAPSRELLGEMLLVLRQPQAALAEFERALQIKPDFADAKANKSRVLR